MNTRGCAVGAAALGMAVFLSGCSAGHHPTIAGSTPVTVTFTGGTPTAVATRTGTSAFASVTPAATITISVPQGTATFAVAFLCPAVVLGTITLNNEHVIEATTQDTTSLHLDCGGSGGLTTGTATGTASSSITGTASIAIIGNRGLGIARGAFTSGPFSATLPAGTNDVAFVAFDSSGLILGTKIVRSQTVPGTINGGAGIVILPSTDSIVPETVTVLNIPVGFNTPAVFVNYNTANGTPIGLVNSATVSNPQTYAAIATADTLANDFYFYEALATNPATSQTLSINQTTTTGGGNVSLTLPTPWSFSGPTPATLPTFTFIYAGFTGQTAIADSAGITWKVGSTANLIDITATANFQNSATTLTIPDLSGLSGFIAVAGSGTTINWSATIFGGTVQQFAFPASSPNATVAFVGNAGTFTQP